MADEAIRFRTDMDTTGFDSGAKRLQSMATSASSAVTNHFGKIAAAVVSIGAAFMAVRSAAQAFNNAIAMGGQLNDLSARTGETAGNLAILQRAFQNAGAGADSVGPTINRLQRAIVEAGQGGKEQAEAFGRLGLSIASLKDLTPTEQLQAVAGALQNVGNDSDRTAIAMKLLGRSGGELIPLLRAMGVELDIARGQLGSTPQIIDQTAAQLDRIGDNFAAIGEKGKEFMVGLLKDLAPGLADLTDRLANIDAAGFGAKLSEYAAKTAAWITETFRLGEALNLVETAVKGITSGNFGDGLKLMFLTARDTAFNAINQIVAAAQAAISSLTGAIAQMFDANGALILLLKTSFTIGANYFKEALYNALADFMDAIGRSGMADTFRYQAETAAKSIETLTFSIGSQIEEVGIQAKETFNGIPQAFKDSYESNMKDPLIDMTERTKETAAQAEKVAAATRAAAFDAQKYADAMSNAREEMLAGGAISPLGQKIKVSVGPLAEGQAQANGPFPVGTRGSGAAFSLSKPEQDGGKNLGGASVGPNFKRQTAIDALKYKAQTDANALAALYRLQDEQSQQMDRAAGARDRGMYRTAAKTELRAQRQAERAASRELMRQQMDALFGARNVGDATRNLRDDARRAGMTEAEALDAMGIKRKQGESTADAINRMLNEQATPDKERKKRDNTASFNGADAGDSKRSQTDTPATEATLAKILDKIQERPILVA